jgi:hypothetical protein
MMMGTSASRPVIKALDARCGRSIATIERPPVIVASVHCVVV